MEKVIVSQLTGGPTDAYMKPRSPTQYQKCENLLLTQEGELLSRPGSALLTDAYEATTLINYQRDTYLLARDGDSLYAFDNATWEEILNPDGDPILPGIPPISWIEWKNQLIIVGGYDGVLQKKPVKVFTTAAGVFLGVTAGLPEMALTSNYVGATALAAAITLANTLETDLATHFADTYASGAAPGHLSGGDTVADAYLSGTAATDLATLLTKVEELQKAYVSHFNDYANGGAYHLSETNQAGAAFTHPAADQTLAITTPPTTLVEAAAALNAIYIAFYSHITDADIHGASASYIASSVVSTSSFQSLSLLDITEGPKIVMDKAKLFFAAETFENYFATHLANTTAHPGGAQFSFSHTTITTDALLTFSVAQMLSLFPTHMDDARKVTPTYHHATGTAYWPFGIQFPRVANAGTTTAYDDYNQGLTPGDYPSIVAALNELRRTFNLHVKDMAAHYVSNPAATALLTEIIPGANLAVADYVYAFVYSYEYSVLGTDFLDVGPPLFVRAENVLATSFQGLQITQIPVLANSSDTAYHTGSIKVQIYRTIDGGNQYFKVGEVTNGTTTFNDTMLDADLVDQEQLYTEGGVVDNDPAPRAKFVTLLGNKAYYGCIEDDESHIRESIDSDLDACPQDHFIALPSAVTGLSATRGFVIGFTKDTSHRIEGGFDERGQGALLAPTISDSVGCVCPYSPVQIEGGVLFWAQDGIYFTDGYNVKKIATDWPTTYQTLIIDSAARESVRGSLDKTNQRVWWATSTGTAYVLDLRHGLNDNSVVTTARSTSTGNFRHLTFFGNALYRSGSNGNIYQHSDALSADAGTAITWDFISVGLLGDAPVRKWVPTMTLQFKNRGNLTTRLYSINDDNTGAKKELAKIQFRDGGTKLIEEKRKFRAGGLRCDQKQIQLTNSGVAAAEKMHLMNFTISWMPLGDAYSDAKGEGDA